jgi:23S rRNA (cytosine1962-C5)-methyltransferase
MTIVQRYRYTAILLVGFLLPSIAFVLPVPTAKTVSPVINTSTCLHSTKNGGGNSGTNSQNRYQKNKKKKTTIGDWKKELLNNPEYGGSSGGQNKRKNTRRTRRRVENPKQRYVYASERKKAQQEGSVDDENSPNIKPHTQSLPILEAKRAGLTNPANQHCDSLVNSIEPVIVGQIRVGEDDGANVASGAYAFLMNKPAGWSILGEKRGTKNKQKEQSDPGLSSVETKKKKSSPIKRMKIKNEKGKDEVIEFDESKIMALLSPEERAMIEAEGDSLLGIPSVAFDGAPGSDMPGWYDVENMTPEERGEAGIEDEDYDPSDIPYFDEADVLALLSEEERELYEAEKKELNQENSKPKRKEGVANTPQKYESMEEEDVDESSVENLRRIKSRLTSKEDLIDTVSFSSFQRPSIVTWLKDKKAAEGNPIRGGKFWTALAGATDVDDSGLVLLCPKKNIKNLVVEYSEYVTVVGNGKFLAPKSKKQTARIPDDAMQVEMISRVRKGREGDVSQTVRFVVSEHFATCSSIIGRAQTQFEDGIRGDPAANPFDRRAPRRLIHCNSMSVSSLLFDETAEAETENFPDDIVVLSDRLNGHKFQKGSFLGRQSLRINPLTNAYREINGAADGFPGWTVDRYNDWLFVQHDEKEPRGPLPSIHDGNTAGVYFLPANPDRSAMGSRHKIRPVLLEGRPAPEVVPVLENGVTYHVSLDKDLSTGMFLDQRANRAWLTRNCNENTKVLNCFAHCGAFSVAAATAGASTVSLDLNKKWLDRVEPQLHANGIEFDERHDCIFGDCFEWLDKLGKRGEKFDIVILDPPSSSVGKKKKRWSVNKDMAELVQLAAPLVKKGGLLWTTTNSASLAPPKFTSLCLKGFETAGIDSKLERIQPMSVDFPSIGPQPVKNLVWRIQ